MTTDEVIFESKLQHKTQISRKTMAKKLEQFSELLLAFLDYKTAFLVSFAASFFLPMFGND